MHLRQFDRLLVIVGNEELWSYHDELTAALEEAGFACEVAVDGESGPEGFQPDGGTRIMRVRRRAAAELEPEPEPA